MARGRVTRAELEEENDMLRSRLAEARDLIDETLGVEEGDPDDEDEDDKNEDEQ